MSNDETEMWMGLASDLSGALAENAVLRNVHSAEKCAGRHCVLHNPSDHHMREWPTMYRAEKGLMERICPHGIGHPDPDDAAYHVSRGATWTTVHGCDGCCEESEWPVDAMLSMFSEHHLEHVFSRLSTEAEKRELESHRPRLVGSGEVFVCLKRDSEESSMRYITTQEGLVEFARALGIPADWHEMDEYGITAEVRGTPGDFGNAFPPAHEYTDTGHAELYVVLQKTEWCDGCKEHKSVKDLAAVNLAMLFAWASGYRDENLGRFKPSIPQPRESTENDDPTPPIDESKPIDGPEEDQRVKEIRRLLVENRGRSALDILLDIQRVIFT